LDQRQAAFMEKATGDGHDGGVFGWRWKRLLHRLEQRTSGWHQPVGDGAVLNVQSRANRL
jgi:hypothetical protein